MSAVALPATLPSQHPSSSHTALIMLWPRMEHGSLEDGSPDLVLCHTFGVTTRPRTEQNFLGKRGKGGGCEIAEYQVEEFAFRLMGSRDKSNEESDP